MDKQYTTGAEMKAAYDAGKILRLKALQGNGVYVYEDLAFFKDGEDYYEFWFSSVQDTEIRTDIYDSRDGWTTTFENVSGKQNKSNKVTSWSNPPTNGNYPSEKLVYDEVHPAVQSSQPAGGFLPNIMYVLGEITGTVTFALSPAVSGIVNHYYWTFETSSTAPTITWPNGITWLGGSAPTINSNKHYEISVLNGIGTFMEV